MTGASLVRAARSYVAPIMPATLHLPGHRSGIPRTRTARTLCYCRGDGCEAARSPGHRAGRTLPSPCARDPDVRPLRPGGPTRGLQRPGVHHRGQRAQHRPRSRPRARDGGHPAQQRDAGPVPAVRLPGTPSHRAEPEPGHRRGATAPADRSRARRTDRCRDPRRPTGRPHGRPDPQPPGDPAMGPAGGNSRQRLEPGVDLRRRPERRARCDAVGLPRGGDPVHRRVVARERPGGSGPPATRRSAGCRDRRAVHPATARGDAGRRH